MEGQSDVLGRGAVVEVTRCRAQVNRSRGTRVEADVELRDSRRVGVVVDRHGVARTSGARGDRALELRQGHLDTLDAEDVVRVVVEAVARGACQTRREHLERARVAEDRSAGTRSAELSAEGAVRAGEELAAADGDRTVDRRVVRGEGVPVNLAVASQVDLAVLVVVLPRNDADALVARGRVDDDSHGAAGRDRLVDDRRGPCDRTARDGPGETRSAAEDTT